MTIIEDAIEMENRAKNFYQESALRITDPSSKKILQLLADEEARHAKALSEMKAGQFNVVGKSSLLSVVGKSSLLSEVKGLVEGAVEQGKDVISDDSSLRDILKKAMEIEQATKQFYERKADSASDSKQKELFQELSMQELSHYLLVSSLSEYFDRPAEWVESAEFGLRPEY
jgi:rubrerythrin